MAVEIVMPRLGWTMEEGVIVEWIKHDGDAVKVGEIVFTVESDKAVNEVESFEDGILRIPPDSPAPGTRVPVGGLLAYIVRPGEAAPFETSKPSSAPASTPAIAAASAPVPSGKAVSTASQHASNGSTPTISPRARRVAAELGVDWLSVKGSGRTGRIVERDIRAAAQTTRPAAQISAGAEAIRATPLARKVAEDLGVSLDAVAASSPGKRIERADVERAAAALPAPQRAAPQPAASAGSKSAVSTMRRITADRMSASARTTAPVTLTTEVDATELVKLRKQLKQDAAKSAVAMPSYNDLLTKLVATALGEHPALNARFDESGQEILYFDSVHIGVAVDTDRGLLVPVIRDVQSKSVRQIAQESAGLVDRARNSALRSEEMQGSTFTITNLGMYEIDAFTPIINLPECAILGIGRIIPKQVVIDAETEQVAIRHMLFLSLTFDHRLVDGAPAARFLQRVKQFIEAPYLWLIS